MATLLRTLRDHSDDVNSCSLSEEILATCSGDKTVRVYSLADFEEVSFSPLRGHGYAVHWCTVSRCARYLASCSTDALTILWSLSTGQILAQLQHPGRSPVRMCCFSPDSSCIISAASDGTVALWDLPSYTLLRFGTVCEGTVVTCSFSPCGQMFVTGSTLGDLRFWSLTMKPLCAESQAHDLGVSCCQFSPQTHIDCQVMTFRLASGGQDSHLKIWMISQHATAGCSIKLLYTLSAQSLPVLSCAFSFDGHIIVSGSVDKTVVIYDANEGVVLHCITQHERYVTACAFSPTELLLATGSMDKTVSIWKIGDALPTDLPKTASQVKKSLGHSRMLVTDWSEEDVAAWLQEEGFDALIHTFKAHNIDGPELITLTKEILATELNVESLGLRSKIIRKIEELKSALTGSDIPDEFLCPITRELMRDPVMAADGYSYERAAIESWITTGNHSSPMTNLPLHSTVFTPNRTLKMAIGRWKASQ
ncbi:WD repeat, SAM and U-box domain-containing protein 1-like [Trichomycterus rosablanca]|uniref:WD repeat, SAM and U-box domain-containing protein 1-like n=1 Tax=Trichomycterus rosablanca TaxID=2290929 RepID=UPI002F36118A